MAALVVGGYLYWRLDDEISRYVKRLVADHYTQLVVDIDSARFEQSQGVFIKNLALLEPRDGSQPQPMLSIDELFLACNVQLEDLMSGKPHLERIVVRRPRLRAVRQSDGRWNVAGLLPLPKFSDDTPAMFVEDATLILEDATRHAVPPLTLRGIDLKLTPSPVASTGGRTGSRAFVVSGSASSAAARKLTFAGTISPDDGTLDLAIDIHGLEISPELAAAIPGPLPAQLDSVEFYATADASIHLVRATPGDSPLRWSANVSLARGRLRHPLLPQPVTELAGNLSSDSQKLIVRQLTGKLGAADFALAGNRQGWSTNAPLGLAGRVQGLAVNTDLQAALPVRLEQLWRRFRPSGIVDAEVRLTFDGHEWRPELTAQCRGLSLTDAEKFPYPIDGATGRISLTPSPASGASQLDLDLVGQGGGRPIHIAAKLDHLAMPTAAGSGTAPRGSPTKPTGWVEVSGEGVSIHQALVDAIPAKHRPFVLALHPQGLLNFRWRFERTDPHVLKGTKRLELELTDCAVQYDKFPYPLQQIRGRVVGENGHFTLSDLVGRDRQGSAELTCQGNVEASEAGLALGLVFRGTSVPLDDNLKQALAPRAPQALKAWTDLRPQGRIDFVANIQRRPGQQKPTIHVDLQPHEQSVSVEPEFFRYRFEQVDGHAIVTDGRVDLRELKGIHGRSLFTANGVWQATPGGGWQLVLNHLNVDRLAFEPDFLRAVPLGVQKVIDRIRPTGNFNAFDSSLRFVRRAESPQVTAQWHLQLACHQSSLRGDLPLDNLTGNIRLMGASDGPNVNSYGELAIDSLIWNDTQFTNVHGPFWSDPTICYLGQQATAKLAQPPRRITADVYGGTLTADAVLQHAGQPRYNAEISIGGVDLGRFARERLGGPSDIKGTVSGKLSLAGAGHSTYSLRGNGDLHVVDANIYQLPPLVAMLKVLRNRTPDSTAFNGCDMKFDVFGENVHFNQLNLLGDAVSLYGRGQTNFDRRLDLTFYTLVGPADLPIPLWKTVAGHLSEQGLQIKVDGTWDNPQTHREALPAVSKMLEQLRAEAEQGAAVVAPPAAAGIPWVTPTR